MARSAIALVLVGGCASRVPKDLVPPAEPGAALQKVAPPALDDDLPIGPLVDAAEAQADRIERSPRIGDFRFGERRVSRSTYAASLRRFAAIGRAAPSHDELASAVAREFDFFEAVFPDPIVVTAYYEPVIDGSRDAAGRFHQPLYRLPDGVDYAVSPGPTRAEIDSGDALSGRGLELCFVDPLDAFVLQTEGSGVVAFADGTRLALDFAGTNGRQHVRIGQFLAGRIPAATMNMHTIEDYLRSIPEREMRAILEKNPRYVFWKPRAGEGPATSIGLPAVDGRSIATDPRFVPKGGLAFLVTEQPDFDRATDRQPARWLPLHRFVLDEDTGGGIKGPRVDLFWGRGAEARLFANAMKRRGRLFYLAPKQGR